MVRPLLSGWEGRRGWAAGWRAWHGGAFGMLRLPLGASLRGGAHQLHAEPPKPALSVAAAFEQSQPLAVHRRAYALATPG